VSHALACQSVPVALARPGVVGHLAVTSAVRWRSSVSAGERAKTLMEAYAFLVGAPVFKTGEGEDLVLAGSIPVRLR
jgi:hypothetical protein